MTILRNATKAAAASWQAGIVLCMGGDAFLRFPSMVSYSILCTNSRNGGQCELLIDAASPERAQRHVADSRPSYIIKTIEPVERKFICYGFCRRNERYDALGYITFSAEQARSICQQLHPDFAIDRVELG